MARLFVSYRREDSAGHAGRLTDYLNQRFGQAEVFRDVEHIEPGLDFVQAIDRAVSSCDILLAVIGKQWLNATDAHGRRRLDNPDDFVRLEIATALRRNIRVIPVLVQGASMPAPEHLPEDLMALSRRNAWELHDTSWSSDIERLIAVVERVLGDSSTGATIPLATDRQPSEHPETLAPAPGLSGRRTIFTRNCLFLLLPLVLLVCVASGWIAWNFARLRDTTLEPSAQVAGEIEPPATPPNAEQSQTSSDSTANPTLLNVDRETRVGDVTYTILAAHLDQPNREQRELRFLIRMTARSTTSHNFWGDVTRLVVDGTSQAPDEAPNEVVYGFSAKEGTFVFRFPSTAEQIELVVGQIGRETATIPIDLEARQALAAPTTRLVLNNVVFPVDLPAGDTVHVGDAAFTVLAAQLERPNREQIQFRFEIRMAAQSERAHNFWSDVARLIVDDVPRAPDDAPNVVVDGHSAAEGVFVFRVSPDLQKVELQVGQIGQETTTIPIDLSAIQE
jgi:hypothetical protein